MMIIMMTIAMMLAMIITTMLTIEGMIMMVMQVDIDIATKQFASSK